MDAVQFRSCGENVAHHLRVLLVVGGQVQRAPGLEDGHDRRRELGPHQSALVVTGFGPWVGEEDEDLLKAAGWQSTTDQIQGVAVQDPQIGEAALLGEQEGPCDALAMHVSGDVVHVGALGRGEQSRIAETGADLEDARRPPAEHCVEIEGVGNLREVVSATEFDQRITLPGGQAAPSGVITPDGFDHAVTLPIDWW